MKFIFSALSAFSLLTQANLGLAAESTFEYPELSVVPRASERVESEAAREKEQSWKVHLPFLVPATVTFATGLTMMMTGTKSDLRNGTSDTKLAPYIGMGVGLAWWGVSLGILNHLDLYSDGAADVAKMPAKTQREQLARERRAEEAINRAGAIARRLKWISVVSNLATGAYMVSSAKEGTFSLYMAIGSALTSLSPLLFTHRWENTEAIQRDYKKRIYAPVVGATILTDPNGLVSSPGLFLSLRF